MGRAFTAADREKAKAAMKERAAAKRPENKLRGLLKRLSSAANEIPALDKMIADAEARVEELKSLKATILNATGKAAAKTAAPRQPQNLTEEIALYLKGRPGVRSPVIAAALGKDSEEVKRVLNNHPDYFACDSQDMWKLKLQAA